MKNGQTDDGLRSVLAYYPPVSHRNPKTQRFIFANRIECSYPTIATEDGVKRRDQMKECGHYEYKKLIEQWTFVSLLPNGPRLRSTGTGSGMSE